MHYKRIFSESWLMFLAPEKKADMAILTLKSGRNEFHFNNTWEKAKFISKNVKSWINKNGQENEEIQLNEL